MRGDDQTIELLTAELTAVNQYVLHASLEETIRHIGLPDDFAQQLHA